MSCYLTSKDLILHDFLKKGQKQSKIRTMTPEELETVMQLREIKKAVNLCMTEMLFIVKCISRLEINELYWISNNFHRIIHSLHKQRDLISAVSAAFSYRKPEPKEFEVITRFIKDIRKRIDFLNSVPVPENLKLTPIQDYMDLIGCKNFIDEVKRVFPTGKDLYESKNDGRMDDYMESIVSALENAGKQEAYKERLEAYISASNDRINKVKEDKRAEKAAYALNESLNGILLFREQFFKGIRTLKGSKEINLSPSAVHYQLAEGNRGKFCILCCRLVKSRLAFRYMRSDGKESPSFSSVGLYQSLEEAGKAMDEFKQMYPADRAFEVVCI